MPCRAEVGWFVVVVVVDKLDSSGPMVVQVLVREAVEDVD